MPLDLDAQQFTPVPDALSVSDDVCLDTSDPTYVTEIATVADLLVKKVL